MTLTPVLLTLTFAVTKTCDPCLTLTLTLTLTPHPELDPLARPCP